MGDEPDLDPEITCEFFQNYVLKFDPTLLTESGMKLVLFGCFHHMMQHCFFLYLCKKIHICSDISDELQQWCLSKTTRLLVK